MGTSAFEKAWGEDPKPTLKRGRSLGKSAFDEAWGEDPAVPRESLKLDIRFPSESTRAKPHNRADRADDVGLLPEGTGDAVLGIIASGAQAIPGMEALQAGVRSLARNQPYREALKDMRGVTDEIPLPIKLAAQAPALIASSTILPFSAAKSGALIGAADQALNADPDVGMSERALRTVAGAGVGGAVGKGAEMIGTGARVARTPNTAKTLQRLDDARSASAGPLYDKALKVEGAAADFTKPGWQAVKARPEVAEAIAGLKQLDEFKAVDADSPEMLDAVYKLFSDRKGLLAKRLDAVSPNRVNLGRFDKRQIENVQSAILDAADEAGMGGYRAAVQDFAQGSARLKGAERGHDAIRSRLNRNLPMAKSLKNTAPESYEKFLRKASPDVAAEAEAGILGGTKAAFGQSVRKSGIPALSEAPDLLRLTKSKRQLAQDRALRALLLGAAAQ